MNQYLPLFLGDRVTFDPELTSAEEYLYTLGLEYLVIQRSGDIISINLRTLDKEIMQVYQGPEGLRTDAITVPVNRLGSTDVSLDTVSGLESLVQPGGLLQGCDSTEWLISISLEGILVLVRGEEPQWFLPTIPMAPILTHCQGEMWESNTNPPTRPRVTHVAFFNHYLPDIQGEYFSLGIPDQSFG